MLVTTAAVRLDGASLHFAPMEFPAVADFACTTALVDAAKAAGAELHIGVTASSDTFIRGRSVTILIQAASSAVSGLDERVAADGRAEL